VAALAALLLGERLRPAGVAGLALGAAGLCLLEAPPDAVLSLPAAASGGSPALAAGAGLSLPVGPGARDQSALSAAVLLRGAASRDHAAQAHSNSSGSASA
jgi:drug/metabolite transporter (DMT)-like permease